MISRKLKATYYHLLAIPMKINGRIYKLFRAPTNGTVKVHFGPGTQNYMPGWINVDANLFAKTDLWADLCNPLPFRDHSVDVFYSHHVIEHLPDSFLPTHCREMYRCLKPGGFIRIGGPNADMAAKKLVEGDCSWFSDFPDARQSIGGRFANFLLCRGEHLTLLTFSYVEELLRGAGFVNIQQCLPGMQTFHPHLIDPHLLSKEEDDGLPDAPHTLIVEAEKRV